MMLRMIAEFVTGKSLSKKAQNSNGDEGKRPWSESQDACSGACLCSTICVRFCDKRHLAQQRLKEN